MKEDLTMEVAEDKFKKQADLKGLPVPEEEVIENIKASAKFDIPLLERDGKFREGSYIFVAGGPSLNSYLDEIRERKNNGELIATSNNTHDYLVDNGIIPDICSMVDPKERCKKYIKKVQKETRYIIAVTCNPQVFKNLIDAGAKVEKMLVGFGLTDEADVSLQMKIYSPKKAMSFLTGGTMMGLRAMNLAEMLGYKKIEYYGMDSCFASESPELVMEGDSRYDEIVEKLNGIYYTDASTGKNYTYDEDTLKGGYFYAYPKLRSEDIQIAETGDGRRFLTCAVFSHQAKQFIKWGERLEGKIEVECHGDSMNTHMWELHRKAKEKAFKKIGDARWTNQHIKDQGLCDLPDKSPDIEIISRPVLALYGKLKRNISILDYACGKGSIKPNLENIFNCIDFKNYDPFVEEFMQEPRQVDYTICSNVLPFVEPQCIDNVLKHIASKTKYMTVITIRSDDYFSDESSMYRTDKNMAWWNLKISTFFSVGEGMVAENMVYFICQKLDAPVVMEAELANK